MVVGAFPAFKLGALLLKQVSKPIANYIKESAKKSPVFRTYVCMPPAQFYNWCEVKTKMWILNLGKPVNIPVLNEAMAIELGANLLGEGILFVMAVAIFMFEYNRSAKKEAAKEAAKRAEMESVNMDLRDLFFQLEEQRVQIKELLRMVTELESVAIKKPRWPSTRHPEEDQKDSPPPPPPPSVVLVEPQIPSDNGSACEPEEISDKPDNYNQPTSLVLKAVQIVENDYFSNATKYREVGILTVALNHLYKEVYKLPVTMY